MSMVEWVAIIVFIFLFIGVLFFTQYFDNKKRLELKYGNLIHDDVLPIYCRKDCYISEEEKSLIIQSLLLADSYLKNDMVGYYDIDIWERCFLSMWYDIETIANIHQTNIVGVADRWVFFHSDLTSHYPIILDIKEIREYKLSKNHIAGVIIHEYKHHWKKVNNNDYDSDHSDLDW